MKLFRHYIFCIPTIFFCYVINIFVIFLTTFESAIPNGITPIAFTHAPPLSKRVVLISIDGLATHILQNDYRNCMSFVMDMAKSSGLIGVIKAEAPTETRPRHVALLSGFNEDLFNIWGGWRRNLHSFESILHVTQLSWGYGDPVAIRPFMVPTNDSRSSRLKFEHYSEGAHNSEYADNFVLEKFKTFIDTELDKFIETEEVTQDGRRGKLLFLHLCSVDDAGHHGGYNAPLYDIAVCHANEVIKQIYELYRKNVSEEDLVSTTFIVTADHGTKPEGGHGGETDDEVYVPFFAWGAGIPHIPNSNTVLPLLGQQNSVNTLVASLLSTRIPSSSMGSLPVNLLNASNEVKSNLLKSNILHLTKLKEAYIDKGNRQSFFSPFSYFGQTALSDQKDNLKYLMKKESEILNSLFYSKWTFWYRASIFWVIAAVITSFVFAVDFLGHRTPKIASRCSLILRIFTLSLAMIELLRVLSWCKNYERKPNFREMLVLPTICILTDFILGDYISSGRLILSKLFESFKITKCWVFKFVFMLLQSHLIVGAFHTPIFYAAVGIIVSINFFITPFWKAEKKCAYPFLVVLTLLYSMWMSILHWEPIESTLNLLGHQVAVCLILFSICALFHTICFSVVVDRLSLNEWFFLEFQNILIQVLLIHTYLFGLNIFDRSVLSAILVTDVRFGNKILLNVPVLVIVAIYIHVTRRRSQRQRKPILLAQTLIWLLFAPMVFTYGFTHMGFVKSWYRIGTDIAYFIYLSVAPLLCASIFAVLSYITEKSPASQVANCARFPL